MLARRRRGRPARPAPGSTERSGEWEPLRPDLVVEVRYDHVTIDWFHHGTKLRFAGNFSVG